MSALTVPPFKNTRTSTEIPKEAGVAPAHLGLAAQIKVHNPLGARNPPARTAPPASKPPNEIDCVIEERNEVDVDQED